jgi:hypothetical protein
MKPSVIVWDLETVPDLCLGHSTASRGMPFCGIGQAMICGVGARYVISHTHPYGRSPLK